MIFLKPHHAPKNDWTFFPCPDNPFLFSLSAVALVKRTWREREREGARERERERSSLQDNLFQYTSITVPLFLGGGGREFDVSDSASERTTKKNILCKFFFKKMRERDCSIEKAWSPRYLKKGTLFEKKKEVFWSRFLIPLFAVGANKGQQHYFFSLCLEEEEEEENWLH